ncbi:MAG TPA: hypothetical protein VGP15_07680, partial [Burkholderiales bacterium]|nr:hypothetical protein [Burkholderiales bacterium]
MSTDADTQALVIGSGADELVAAHYLARAGLRVRVLRESRSLGAPLRTGWIPPAIVRELALEQKGLAVQHPDPWAIAPLPGGGRLALTRDVARSAEAIRAVSARDAQRWPEFCRRMHALAAVLEHFYGAPPPDPLTHELGGYLALARDALRVRKLGRQGIEDLLRLMPMPVADLLDEWFESDVLKGVLGAAGIVHLSQGPRSGGTAFNFLHHHVGSPPGVFRQPLSNVDRVLGELADVGIQDGRVARIELRKGGVTGVVLDSGEEIAASLVL